VLSLSLAEIAALTGGTIHDTPDPRAQVTGPLAFDSRQPMPGGLFLALVAARDGHDFAQAAVAAGATAVLGTRPVGVPAVVVPDVLEAAAAITAELTSRLDARLIGVTGSSGKTSTKDLLAQVFPALGTTVATEQSFNGEVGVPVTVSRADADTRFLVLEMGARGVGHIRYLTRMAPLSTAIVLNIGAAHLGEFGSVEQTAVAKAELVEDLPEDGWAILNADDPRVAPMAGRTRAQVVTFGLSEAAQIRATAIRVDNDGRASFTLSTPTDSAPVHLRLAGEHHVLNALATAGAALAHGATVEQVADLLGDAEQVSAGRMEVTDRPDGVRIVNDAYNANPDSMRAAIKALAAMTRDTGRRPVAVLGSMLELGDHAAQAHREVGRLAAQHGAHVLAVGGEEAQWIADGAAGGDIAADAEHAHKLLDSLIQPGDVVLFKSSRDAGLRHLAARVAQQTGA